MADGYVNDDLAVVQQIANLPQWNGIPEYLQIHLMSTHALGAREAEFERWTPTHNYYGNPAFSGTADELNNKVINYYDNGMLQFDRNVARVIEALESRGYLSDALVVITGDHGEMLGEHQLYSHGNGVFQPVIEVPLIMLRFGHSGPAYNTQAGTAQIDIAPTIASELGVPVPNRWQGLTLDKVQDRKFAFFTHKEEFGLLDYTQPDKQWKYWLHRKSGLEYAYELTSDPSESDNRIVSIPPAQRAAWREVLYPSLVSLPLH
jgi:arylsulfatase A-like enzyme